MREEGKEQEGEKLSKGLLSEKGKREGRWRKIIEAISVKERERIRPKDQHRLSGMENIDHQRWWWCWQGNSLQLCSTPM